MNDTTQNPALVKVVEYLKLFAETFVSRESYISEYDIKRLSAIRSYIRFVLQCEAVSPEEEKHYREIKEGSDEITLATEGLPKGIVLGESKRLSILPLWNILHTNNIQRKIAVYMKEYLKGYGIEDGNGSEYYGEKQLVELQKSREMLPQEVKESLTDIFQTITRCLELPTNRISEKEEKCLLEEFDKVERYLASSEEVPDEYLLHFEHFADFLKGFMLQSSAVRYEQEEFLAYWGVGMVACISQEVLLRELLKPKVSGKQAVKAMKNIEAQLGEILGENKVVSDELYRVLKRMERKIRDVTTETKRENAKRKKRNRDGHTTVKE